MSDTTWKRHLYKAPKKEILQNRRAFYDLKRGKNESIDEWLKRIQKCIGCCDFPIFVEFLLIDRFVCGLNRAEMKIILDTETWSLKQLLDYFFDQNIHNGSTDKSDKPNENVSAHALDSESVNVLEIANILQHWKMLIFLFFHSFYYI